MWEPQVHSLDREDALEKGTVTHSSMVPGEFHGQRSLEGYSPWGPKESDVTQRLNNGIPTLQMGRLQFILIHLVSSRSY